MKQITVNVNDDQVEQLLSFLHENDFDWISDNDADFEVPQWQQEMSSKRWKEFEKDPTIAIPWKESLTRLEEKRV